MKTIKIICKHFLRKKRIVINDFRELFFRALWLLYPFKQKEAKSKLVWISQYYNSGDQERQAEIDETMLANTRQPWVEKIVLFTNTESPSLVGEKIEIIKITERLHFREILVYISRQKRDCENVYCITNSDIILTDDIIKIVPRILQKQLIALTRWEIGKRFSYEFLPEITQDTWIIRDADFSDVAKLMDCIPLGIPGCDNRFSRIMHDAGFIIWNPCLNVKTFHNHRSGRRSYTIDSRVQGDYFFPLECSKEQFFLQIKRRFTH